MKFKYHFQKVLPKARKFSVRDTGSQAYKLKNVQCREVMHMLKAAGYVVEGETNHENNTTFGMVRDGEHVIITDSGKYPFYLGDTTIRPGYMRVYYDAPINLR